MNPILKIIEDGEKWILENHNHHEFCDEKLPKGVYGCTDKDRPYVDSLEAERFFKSHLLAVLEGIVAEGEKSIDSWKDYKDIKTRSGVITGIFQALSPIKEAILAIKNKK